MLSLAVAAVAAALAGGDGTRPAGFDPGQVRPKPPSRYEVPRDAVVVSTSAELRKVLERSRPTAIVLANGVYDGAEPFRNSAGHRLYAARLGGAVLRAGLSVGGDSGRVGGLVRGLVFDVRDPTKTLDDAEIAVWGAAKGTRVLDVTLRGNGRVGAGLVVREPEGFAAARLVVRDFTDYGVLIDANDPDLDKLARPFRLADVDVADVARPVPGSSEGTAEACVWIGNPGSVLRVRARRCALMGLWTGTATTGALFSRIDVDRAETGVYIEHFTRRSTFRRLRVGSQVRIGVLAEWADPDWGGRPASVGNVIENSRFESRVAGVYLDEGTTRTTVRRSTFVNQRWAAIGDYAGIANAFSGNDYGGVAPDAADVTRDHLSSFEEGGE